MSCLKERIYENWPAILHTILIIIVINSCIFLGYYGFLESDTSTVILSLFIAFFLILLRLFYVKLIFEDRNKIFQQISLIELYPKFMFFLFSLLISILSILLLLIYVYRIQTVFPCFDIRNILLYLAWFIIFSFIIIPTDYYFNLVVLSLIHI